MKSAVKILGIAGGVGAAFIIGIIAFGEITKPPGSDILERPTEQWRVGESLTAGTSLTYSVSHIDRDYEELVVTLEFIGMEDRNWRTLVSVTDPNGDMIEQEIVFSQSLVPVTRPNEQMEVYMKIIQSSLLWIVDYAIEPKYLAAGAVWGSITHGVQEEDLVIQRKESVDTEAGMFESYLLSYTIMGQQSKIWIVNDMPLPVKAEVFAEGSLQFAYELVST